jgi:hypothetical protein
MTSAMAEMSCFAKPCCTASSYTEMTSGMPSVEMPSSLALLSMSLRSFKACSMG